MEKQPPRSLRGTMYNCPRELWIAISFIAVMLGLAYLITIAAVTPGDEDPVMFVRPDCPSNILFPLGEGNVFTGVVVTLTPDDHHINDAREDFLVELLLRKDFRGSEWSGHAIRSLSRRGDEHATATDPILCLELCKASHIPFDNTTIRTRSINTTCNYTFKGFEEEIVNHTAVLYVSQKPTDCIVLGGAFNPTGIDNLTCHGHPFFPVEQPHRCEDPRHVENGAHGNGRIPVGNLTSCWFHWAHSEGYAWILKEARTTDRTDDDHWPEVHGVFSRKKHVVIPQGDYWWLRGHRRLHQDTAALVVTYLRGTRVLTYAVPLSNTMNGDAIPF
jgi:hypothetical protein